MIKNISLRFLVVFVAFVTAGLLLVLTLERTMRMGDETEAFHQKVTIPLSKAERIVERLHVDTLLYTSPPLSRAPDPAERKEEEAAKAFPALINLVETSLPALLGKEAPTASIDAIHDEFDAFMQKRKFFLERIRRLAEKPKDEVLRQAIQKARLSYLLAYNNLMQSLDNLKRNAMGAFRTHVEEQRKQAKDIFYISLAAAAFTLVLLTLLLLEVNSINRRLKNYLEEREEIQQKLAKANEELARYSEELESEVKKQTEEALEHLLKNPLTKFPNRISFLKKLQDVSHASVAIFNIDRFQTYNDLFGAEVGDRIIKDYAAYLRQTIPYVYPIYHLQGDEFAVVETSRKSAGTFLAMIKQAAKIAGEFHYTDTNGDYVLQISIGVAIDQRKPLIKADMALKHAKHSNERLVVYDSELIQPHRYLQNVTMTKELTVAIREERIVPYYQAIARSSDGSVVKYEALARLIDSKGEVRPPVQFIPLAKQIRLYPEITKVIFKQAMDAVEAHGIHVSVNLSADDIHHQPTRDYIIDRLALSKRSGHVTFELLESEETKSYDDIRLFIEKVKHFGVKVAIDDFGSGYSNFAKILKLKVDYLKIDGSFIRRIDSDQEAREFVEIMHELASSYGIETVAEFVSGESIYRTVQKIGIDYVQGYYIAEPRPLESILNPTPPQSVEPPAKTEEAPAISFDE